MQRRHFMKLTGLLATLPAYQRDSCNLRKKRSIRKATIQMGVSTRWKKARTAWTTFSTIY